MPQRGPGLEAAQGRRTGAATALALVLTLILTLALALTGCGEVATGEASAASAFDPSNALSQPKEYVGPSTARVVESAIEPITDNPAPDLPAQVTDAQGSAVTITDVSRILALDIYGTTSRIVYSLGLGGNVIGRDTSSAFDEIKDLPRVTPEGNTLNAEAILELAPSVIIT
ncbi:MAG: hypothetical protein LBG11_01120, partial [Bifidobacteriaceae bacterium]|nr:hypothetical protein [Bifidobacteriaceae bacterium]